MRLLISGINWPPETFIRRLIDGLLRAGTDVTVVATRNPAQWTAMIVSRGYKRRPGTCRFLYAWPVCWGRVCGPA